jgi:lipopolysaccharide transport system permease protein
MPSELRTFSPIPNAPRPALPVDAEPGLALTVIEARRGWRLVNFRELWRYRELLYFLSWRDIKVRYKQAALGIAWSIVQPFVTMVVFSLFLARIAGGNSTEVPYPLFVFAGLLPWYFLSNSITAAGQSVVGSQNLVTKVYFPRLIIPASAVAVALVDLLVAFSVLLAMILYYGRLPAGGLLWLPVVVFGLVMLAIGVGTLLAALTVAYRDFRHVVPFGVQLWMFATPSIYIQQEAAVDGIWRVLFRLNPAHGLISSFRAAVLGLEFDYSAMATSAGVGLALILLGCSYFRRVEGTFADVI